MTENLTTPKGRPYPADACPCSPCRVAYDRGFDAASPIENVRAFHEMAEAPIAERPTSIALDRRALRYDLQHEELGELDDAMLAQDLVEIADALADTIYIAAGTALEYGIPLDAVFAEVQRSNMAKFPDGVVLRRDDGKILKPDGWTPPDIRTIIDAVISR